VPDDRSEIVETDLLAVQIPRTLTP
jgi:hypothetical protein